MGRGQPEKVYIQGEYAEPHPVQCVRIFEYLIEQQCPTFSFDMAVLKVCFCLLVVKAMVFNQESSDGVAMTVTLFFIDVPAGRTMHPVYSVIAPANVVVDDGFGELLQSLGTELYLSGLNDRERKEE